MKHSEHRETSDNEPQSTDPRRRVIKAVLAGGAVSTSSIWVRPVIDSILLPAHAQTSATPGGGAGAGAGDLMLPAASASATPDDGVSIVVNDAQAGESVVVTAVVAGKEASVTVKANEAGRAAATISRDAMRSAVGRELKAGETIQIKVQALSSRKTATMSLQVKEAVATPLVISLEADADTGTALVTARNAKASELVSASLVVAGREVIVSGKANADGVAKMAISRDAIAAAGAKLERGANISVTVKSASGARGAATAVVAGREVEPAALKFDSATGNMSSGLNLALSGARGGELVTLNLQHAGRSIALKMKTAENGTLKTEIAMADLKELELREGAEVAISAVTDSGLRVATSVRMAAGAAVIRPVETRPVTNTTTTNATTATRPTTNATTTTTTATIRPVNEGNRGR